MRDARVRRRRPPRRYLVPAVLLGAAVAIPSVTARTEGSVALSAVRNLVATLAGDVATVSWSPPAQGAVGGYTINAILDGSDYGTRITNARTTSITWDRIAFNQSVQFEVAATAPDGPGGDPGGTGPVNETGTLTAGNSYCPPASGDCVVVDTGIGLGTEGHPGASLLHGTLPLSNPLDKALDLTHWRISAEGLALDGATEYSQATADVPSSDIIEVLSDAWYGHTEQGFVAADPWANWTAYDSFIASVVRAAVKAGHDPIWEIQNEPENFPYSSAEPPTRSLVEQEYLHAYDAIKSVDPSARVIAPAIDWSYDDSGALLDMASFMSFASAHDMKLYAISWHENCCQSDQDPLIYEETPQVVRDEAEVVRTLIDENPGVGDPQLYLDENSSAAGNFIPGFAAGYAAEENRAGVNEAGRTCWAFPDTDDSYDSCFGPYLDDLLNIDGQPNASYWTMADYAEMTGQQVWSETSDTNLSSLAVTDGTGVTRILLGRHQTCSGWTVGEVYCAAATPPPPIPTTIQVLVARSSSSAAVTLQRIPDVGGDMRSAPATERLSVPVVGGVATVRLPDVGDGAAYFVTVKPGSRSDATPGSGNQRRDEVPPPTGPSTVTRALIEGGADACATMGDTFANPLQLIVTNQYGDPMSGIPVTFGVPGGAATFTTGSTLFSTKTGPNGIATSAPVRAGADLGGFSAVGYVTGRQDKPPGTLYFNLTDALLAC